MEMVTRTFVESRNVSIIDAKTLEVKEVKENVAGTMKEIEKSARTEHGRNIFVRLDSENTITLGMSVEDFKKHAKDITK